MSINSVEKLSYSEVLAARGEVLRWPVPQALAESPEVAFRNRQAGQLVDQPLEEVLKRYLYTTSEEMELTLKLIGEGFIGDYLNGVGMELGAGCGLLSSTLVRDFRIEAVLALEVVERMAELIVPKVASGIVGEGSERVIPVIGSFDDIRLQDEALDFVVEIDSLHHSPNLDVTLAEVSRVLKPGGRLLCLDRTHPDWVPDSYINEQLNRVYSKEFLKENGYPEDVVLTREQNGEHEYRIGEWLSAFDRAGFRAVKVTEIWNQVTPAMALKSLLSVLPGFVKKRLFRGDDIPVQASWVWFKSLFVSRDKLYGRYGGYIFTPYRKTVMLLEKK